jgi:hypothetical protein
VRGGVLVGGGEDRAEAFPQVVDRCQVVVVEGTDLADPVAVYEVLQRTDVRQRLGAPRPRCAVDEVDDAQQRVLGVVAEDRRAPPVGGWLRRPA